MVDGIIAMDEPMPHAHDRQPRYLRMSLPLVPGNPRCGFTDDLDQPDEAQLEEPVAFEIGPLFAPSQFDCLPGMVEHMQEAKTVITPRHSRGVPRSRLRRGNGD